MPQPPTSTPESTDDVHTLAFGSCSYRMKLPNAGTDYIQRKLAETKEPYERDMLEDMASRLSAGDVVVDVGANVGNHTIYLAAVAGCRVIAFEPNLELAAAIRESAQLNGLTSSVSVHGMGLGNIVSTASFGEYKPDNLGAQRLVLGAGAVTVGRLDDCQIPQPVKAIKIDVEGMEVDVLRGAAGVIARDRPILYVECISDKEFRAVSRCLEKQHYMCWDTFNITPTHLFRPVETISLDDKLAKVQGRAVHETYRTGLLLTSVRSRLANAAEAERAASAALAKVQIDRAVADEQAKRAKMEASDWQVRSQHAIDHAQRVDLRLGELEASLADTRGRLERAVTEAGTAKRLLADTQDRLAQSNVQAEAAQARLRRMSAELQSLQERGTRLIADQRRLKRLVSERTAASEELNGKLDELLASRRYRLGCVLAEAMCSPRQMLRLPFALWRLWRGPRQLAVAPEASAVAQEPVLFEGLANDVRPRRQPKALHLRPLGTAAQLRVAALTSPAVQAHFDGACAWTALELANADLAQLRPDVVLIEAAHVCGRLTPAVQEHADVYGSGVEESAVIALLADADRRGIPTVLWCDTGLEECPAYGPVATAVDLILTQDLDSIPIFQRALGHGQIALWPMAFQPRLDNPYLHIAPLEGVAANDETARIRAIAGIDSVWVDIDSSQRQSTITHSVIQLIARLKLPVAPFSRALRLLWGDLAISSDDSAQRLRAAQFLALRDPGQRVRAHLAWRKLNGEHSVARRLATLVSILSGTDTSPSSPAVCVIAEVESPGDLTRVAASFSEQSYAGAQLWLVRKGDFAPPEGTGEDARWATDRTDLVARLEAYDFVAVMDPRDHYGRDYLAELMMAAGSGVATVYTKTAHYAATGSDSDPLTLVSDVLPWQPDVKRAVLRASLLTRARLQLVLRTARIATTLGDLVVQGDQIASVDEFSYCQGGAGRNAHHIDPDRNELWSGVTLAALRAAAQAGVSSQSAVPDAPFDPTPGVQLEPRDWLGWLPAPLPQGVTLEAAPGGDEVLVRVESGNVRNVYLSRKFGLQELRGGSETLMRVEASVRGDVRMVLVFFDSAGKKISHLMRQVGGGSSAQDVPARTAYAQIAFRFQAAATGSLGRIVLSEPKLPAAMPIATAPYLVIGKQYPGYDDLYRFGFVHARVRGYRAAGTRVEVFRLTQDPRGSFREFEDVNVQEGDEARLRLALANGSYRALLVHFMDRTIWSMVVSQLDSSRVIIWVHGAEIQPWWRRAMNFETDKQRDLARKHSDERLGMWREVLALDHPNLTLVFVSAKQAAEAFTDLDIRPRPHQFRIIPNYIDGGLFAYRPKPAEQRRKILSIRPFASGVYANDLTVAAILKLSQDPTFPLLDFRIIGDGALFEQTVQPLRGFSNVTIEQRFLTQHQIAELHREFGIFLVPSRMDSQGVSRDEAMASGLVPITTRIAAIPEFVDASCGILVDPEDADGLARAILSLQHDPERFQALSCAAAARVRAQSGAGQTIGRELELVRAEGERQEDTELAMNALPKHIAVYGDLNLNVMDGSAIWAASLAETLAGLPAVSVSLVFKARIHRTQVIARLLDMTPRVQFVEPAFHDRNETLDVHAALDRLVGLDQQHHFIGFVLRGFDLCSAAAARPALHGRLWAYLTDIPQSDQAMTADSLQRVAVILDACRFLICQTRQFEAHILKNWPQARGKTIILSPMIPPQPTEVAVHNRGADFKVCYAGKFAPNWGIRELFRSFDLLRQRVPTAVLHVFGDKVHNPTEDPSYRAEVLTRLQGGEGLVWHGAVDRAALMGALREMDVCWAFRDPVFEQGTHELSTKVLEYASLGVPIILTRNAVNEEVLGSDYPLFAGNEQEAAQLLMRVATSPDLAQRATDGFKKLAARFSFDAVRDSLLAQGLLGEAEHRGPLAGS